MLGVDDGGRELDYTLEERRIYIREYMRGHQMKGGEVREVKCGVGAVMSEGPITAGLMRQLKKFPTASFQPRDRRGRQRQQR
jgi:hypothetical protein